MIITEDLNEPDRTEPSSTFCSTSSVNTLQPQENASGCIAIIFHVAVSTCALFVSFALKTVF